MAIDLKLARERFEDSTDFTVALEEEFSLLDPTTLDSVQRFEDVMDEAARDPFLNDLMVGELIRSEVEIKSGRCESFDDVVRKQQQVRIRLYEVADRLGIALGATATHPWVPWQEQKIIDTPHYRMVEEGLKYVAWRNNTFSMHVHVGINGADRAIAVCDRMREILPELLALSSNSPYLDGRLSGLHSARSQIFTRSFPRCGIPNAFGTWQEHADFVDFLVRSNSVVESTQLWWSVRPHHMFGTVEIRICDAQYRGDESYSLAALMYACVAQAARDYDAGIRHSPTEQRKIDENLWRAIRYGLDGKMIELPESSERPTVDAVAALIDWTEPVQRELGVGRYLGPVRTMLDAGNGAQRQITAHEGGEHIREVFEETIETSRRTYVGAEADEFLKQIEGVVK